MLLQILLQLLKKNQDYTNAIELSEKARQLLDIKEEYKPVELLRTILNDYNHIARQREEE